VANVALIRQNRELKNQMSLPQAALEAAPGTQVPDLKGYDVDKKALALAYGQDPRKVLVLVFSPTCHFCDENWPRWRQLVPELDPDAVRPIEVDVTSTTTADFASQHQLGDVPVIVQVDPAARIGYRFQLTPQTILVDRHGKVEKVWSGVLNDSAMAEIKQRAGVKKSLSAVLP